MNDFKCPNCKKDVSIRQTNIVRFGDKTVYKCPQCGHILHTLRKAFYRMDKIK